MTEKDVDRLFGSYYARRLARGDGLYGDGDVLACRGVGNEGLRLVERADAARADAARADASRADAARDDARLSAVLAAAALVMMLGFGAIGSLSGAEDTVNGGLVASMSIDISGTRFEEAVVAIGDSWPRRN